MSLERADKIAQDLWDEDVNAWQGHWVPVFKKFAPELVSVAQIHDGQLVLDVGTGTGIAAVAAAKITRHGFVFGIDRSLPILSIANFSCGKFKSQNVRFLPIDARNMQFPDGLFDCVISNCGIPFSAFNRVAAELFRVLRRGGSLAYNTWHLKDVKAHRIFGDILQKHRTTNPSTKLRTQRTALATLERHGNWEMNWKIQSQELMRTGFRNIRVRRKLYRVRFASLDDFLEMRLSRATLRQELKELSRTKRTEFYKDLRAGLRQFSGTRGFAFQWGITFIRATKPGN